MAQDVGIQDAAPLGRLFLFTLLPQVLAGSAVIGISAFKFYGVQIPDLTSALSPLESPWIVAALGLTGLAVGTIGCLLPGKGRIAAIVVPGLGFSFILLLLVWLMAAQLPFTYGPHAYRATSPGFWWSWCQEHSTAVAFVPLLFPVAAGLKRSPGMLSAFSCAHAVVLVLATPFIFVDRQQLASTVDQFGPLPWDLAFCAEPTGPFLVSLAASAILGTLCWFRPLDLNRWGPAYVLLCSAATIVICARKLGYFCARF